MASCAAKEQIVSDILSKQQLECIRTRLSEPGSRIVGYQQKPASELGMVGFLGEHYRVTVCVNEDNKVRKIHLFVKTVPTSNKPKAEMIVKNQFFKREALIFKEIFEEIQEVDYMNPWCIKPIIYTDNILVMPDVSIEGYTTYPKGKYFDLNHVLLTVSSLARFHATIANYFTKKLNKNPPDNLLDDYKLIVTEQFWEIPWLRVAAKLTTDILKEFSPHSVCLTDLKDKLFKLYIEGTDSLKYSEDSLNVIIHRDLWANNILFKYTDDVPVNAVLIDFQLIRYAPPAFDLMALLYLNTSRSFRDSYEKEVLRNYFAIFSDNLDDLTKRRIKELNYDCEAFLACCEKARFFGLVQAIVIFPFVLMEPDVAQKTFDDPDTYLESLEGDRSEPVLAHARENYHYRLRQVEVSEEFVEKYVT